jgi:hypothetical protein
MGLFRWLSKKQDEPQTTSRASGGVVFSSWQDILTVEIQMRLDLTPEHAELLLAKVCDYENLPAPVASDLVAWVFRTSTKPERESALASLRRSVVDIQEYRALHPKQKNV